MVTKPISSYHPQLLAPHGLTSPLPTTINGSNPALFF